MLAITVLNRGNIPTGPYTRTQVSQKLQAGELSLNDLAFVAGLSQWTPLRDVLVKVDAESTSVPLPPPPPVAVAPGAPYSYAVTMQPPTHLVYAGFWLRFIAHLIDALILSVPAVMLWICFAMFIGGLAVFSSLLPMAVTHSPEAAVAAVAPVGGAVLGLVLILSGLLVLPWLYFAFLESGPYQSTFGKRAMGIKVTSMSGERISFGHATGRYFSKIITGMVHFGIGYMMAGFTERKQALHDMIASTLVVRN